MSGVTRVGSYAVTLTETAFGKPSSAGQGAEAPTRRNFAERLAATPDRDDTQLRFERWWTTTRQFEGTLSDWKRQAHNAVDRGGPSNFGITERTFRACAGAAQLPPTQGAFETLTAERARRIALGLWKTSGAPQLEDPGVALVVGDWFWGSNTHAWRRIIDALRGVGYEIAATAGFDEHVISLLNSLPARSSIELLSQARRQHHDDIVASDPSQAVFLRGWQRRTNERERLALSLSYERTPESAGDPGSLRSGDAVADSTTEAHHSAMEPEPSDGASQLGRAPAAVRPPPLLGAATRWAARAR